MRTPLLIKQVRKIDYTDPRDITMAGCWHHHGTTVSKHENSAYNKINMQKLIVVEVQ